MRSREVQEKKGEGWTRTELASALGRMRRAVVTAVAVMEAEAVVSAESMAAVASMEEAATMEEGAKEVAVSAPHQHER